MVELDFYKIQDLKIKKMLNIINDIQQHQKKLKRKMKNLLKMMKRKKEMMITKLIQMLSLKKRRMMRELRRRSIQSTNTLIRAMQRTSIILMKTLTLLCLKSIRNLKQSASKRSFLKRNNLKDPTSYCSNKLRTRILEWT